jgi:hypothetical protein
MTFDDIRQIALSFPEVEGDDASFRIRKRLLAFRPKIDPEKSICIKVPNRLEREFLLQSKPEVYYMHEHYANFECLLAWMSEIDPQEFRELLEDAYASYAPKKLVKAYQEKKG